MRSLHRIALPLGLLSAAIAACAPSLLGTSSTSGVGSGVTNAMIMAQNLVVTAQYGSAAIGTLKWNDYVRRCTGGTNTCSGVTDGVTACTGAETGGATACIHAAEHVKVPTTIPTCTGVSVSDTLGVFDWNCALSGGVAVFTSQLKSGKGLKDLITAANPVGSWKSNAVSITNGSVSNTNTASVWYSNLIRQVPNNNGACAADADPSGPSWTCIGAGASPWTASLDQASTIYTVTAGNTTRGYNLNAHKVALVVMSSSAPVIGHQSASNCDGVNFDTGGATDRCIVAAGSKNFLWIEGKFTGNVNQVAGNIPNIGLGLAGVKFSRVHLATFENVNNYAVRIEGGTHYNRFDQLRAQTSGSEGIYLLDTIGTGINGNILWDVAVSSVGNDGISFANSHSYNVLTNAFVSNGNTSGIIQRGGFGLTSLNNTISRFTSANNTADGILEWGDGGVIQGSIIHNILIAGNAAAAASSGIEIEASSGGGTPAVNYSTYSQILISRTLSPNGAIHLDTATSAKFTGNLIVGNNVSDCTVIGGTTPGLNNTCDPVNRSDHNKVTGVDMRNNFVLEGADATNTYDDANGETLTAQNLVSPYVGWDSFDHWYKAWGGDDNSVWPSTGRNSQAFWSYNSQAQIYDWSLKTTATVARNTTGTSSSSLSTNTTPSATACPSAVAGSVYLTSNTYTYDANYFGGINGIETAGGDSDGICEVGETCVQRYLKNAVEIMDDLVGDDDGLCESGERCLYTPNFGAYQGHGTPTQCTFTDGTVTGVTMYYYPTNGY